MAQFRIPMQLAYARDYGDAVGVPASSCGFHTETFQLTPAFAGGFLVALSLPHYAELVKVNLILTGGFAAKLSTLPGRSDWLVSGLALGDGFVANGLTVFEPDTRNIFRVSAAAAALVAVGVTTMQVEAWWKPGANGGVFSLGNPTEGANPPQFTRALFSEYADDAQGDVPSLGDLRGLFSREEARLAASGGGSTRVTLPSGPRSILKCNVGYGDPWGKVFLTSADIGNGAGQISTDRANWQASQFRNHPQVFCRFADNVRGVATATNFGFLDAFPLTGTPAVQRLYQVDRPPLYSTWLCIIDGQPQVLTFRHPEGSDLRRPLDIWNGVLVPAIESMSAYGGPDAPLGTPDGIDRAVTYEPAPGSGVFDIAAPAFPATTFRQRGGLPRRMNHLHYARILQLWDTRSVYDDPPYTEVPTSD